MNKLLSDGMEILATLAKEAKMKTKPLGAVDPEIEELKGNIAAAEYMSRIFEHRYRTGTNIVTVTTHHQAMMECRRHAAEQRAKLQNILDADAQHAAYLRDSV